jgi:hypothetical protein
MIEYHNPDAQVGVETVPYELSASITGADAIDIGFLANGFPDSENFLQALGAAMHKLAPAINVVPYNKGNASIAAGPELLSEIKERCAAVVAAYGH